MTAATPGQATLPDDLVQHLPDLPAIAAFTARHAPGMAQSLIAAWLTVPEDERAECRALAEAAAPADLALASLAAERNQLRIALERIVGYAAGTATKRMIGDTARKALDNLRPDAERRVAGG